MKYLYEPSVEAVAETLSGEVFAQILRDTWSESQLAKMASRLMQLDNVVVGIDKQVKKLAVQRRQIERGGGGRGGIGRGGNQVSHLSHPHPHDVLIGAHHPVAQRHGGLQR